MKPRATIRQSVVTKVLVERWKLCVTFSLNITDIFCIDKSRVVLKWPPGMQDDFIHANWVTHELFENKFICTQVTFLVQSHDFGQIGIHFQK